MKVLITTDWYEPTVNGVVPSVVNLAGGLIALGHEVKILTLSGDTHSHVCGNVTYIGSVGVGMIYPNARLKAAPSAKYVRALVAWRPDVVHSQCEFSTFYLAKRIASMCGCPLVHTYHTVYEDFTHYFSPSVRFGKRMAASFSKRILGKTQAVIAPTCKVRDMLIGYGVKAPIFIVPSGLALSQFQAQPNDEDRSAMRARLGLAESDFVLLYLGRLAQEKNVEELLGFLQGADDPRVKLLLVGDGPCRTRLAERAQAAGLDGRVIFAGQVAPSKVARYYSVADVFVSASNSETQGLTYIEAMASGLPLLCRDDPCLTGVIQDGVNGCLYRNETEFAGKLMQLLSDSSFRNVIGKAARETAMQRFSEKRFAETVRNIYWQLRYRAMVNAAQPCTIKRWEAAQ